MVNGTGGTTAPITASPIRRIGPADLAACLALSADRGWSTGERQWALLLEATEGYGADDPDGGLAGTVVLGRYGTSLASIGMMLVASRHGRQGLGRTLMTHVLARAGAATVFLTATDFGLPLYRKLGFCTMGRNGNFTGTFRPLPGDGPDRTRAATGDDLAAILEIDRYVFGADRGYLIRRLFRSAGQVRVLAPHGAVTGYAAATAGGGQTIIGPVIAPDAVSAQALIAGLARRIGGQVRTDLDPGRQEIVGWAEAHGLPQVAETAFMVHGTWPLPGHRENLYAPITVALG